MNIAYLNECSFSLAKNETTYPQVEMEGKKGIIMTNRVRKLYEIGMNV